MKARIESTTQVVQINNLPARVWQGETDNGTKFTAFITRIAVEKNENADQFERELSETTHLKPDNAWLARMLL